MTMTMAIPMKSIIGVTLLYSSLYHQPSHAKGSRLRPFDMNFWGKRTATMTALQKIPSSNTALILFPRRGGDDGNSETITTRVESLDERVFAAMRRLGLGGEEEEEEDVIDHAVTESSNHRVDDDAGALTTTSKGTECEGGVCTIIEESDTTSNSISAEIAIDRPVTDEQVFATADRISMEMSVPRDIVLAAIYSSFSGKDENRQLNEDATRFIIQAEIDAIAGVSEDCAEVKQLVEEGYDDIFLVRRSLAFSEFNVDNARAILDADKEDEEAERANTNALVEEEAEPGMRTVTVDYPKNFDPLASDVSRPPQPKQERAPTPAKREDVIFEGTAEELQKLVLESPVPVLLDVYADWCGPCKQLTPVLEQICINAGGMLRLVKINTDLQRQVSGALDVKSLPTVFGIRDGKIVHSFMGLPRDEQMIRNFLMGLIIPGQKFNPPPTLEEEKRFEELSGKLLKIATGASFSFAAREVLQSHVGKLLNQLVEGIGGDTGMAVADDSARVLRTIMSNVIAHPFDEKFRKIKLGNDVIKAKIAQHQPCLAVLRAIGFVLEDDSVLVVAKGKKIVNIAPFVVARDCIDKWIDKNRHQISAAGRKRKDEMDRVRLAAEQAKVNQANIDNEGYEDDDDEVELEDTSRCIIRVRLDGKKKVHHIETDAEDTLNDLLEKVPFQVSDGEVVQLTCVAKRLVIKSTNTEAMSKSLAQLQLVPTASIVIKLIGETANTDVVVKRSLAERAVSQRKKKSTGSHSMHSIGLYAKDDGSKAEVFESGGVIYEHDVTDIEDGGEEEVEDGKIKACGDIPVEDDAK